MRSTTPDPSFVNDDRCRVSLAKARQDWGDVPARDCNFLYVSIQNPHSKSDLVHSLCTQTFDIFVSFLILMLFLNEFILQFIFVVLTYFSIMSNK